MKRTMLGFIALSMYSAAALAQSGGAPAKPADKAAPTADSKPAPAAEPQMDPKMMEAMQKYATPGAEHAKLKSLAGSWDAKVTMWMDPKAPPMEMTGKSEMKMVLGDRYLMQEFSGNMMGMPFSGVGMVGYNNVLKKYQQVWVDNMSTGFINGEGGADKEGVITFINSSTDPMKNKVVKGKDIWKIEGDKRIVSEMWGPPHKGGKDFKMLEIVYTRK